MAGPTPSITFMPKAVVQNFTSLSRFSVTMAKWRMRAIMLVSFHGSFIQSIDVAFLFQALHGAKIKISFNIHAGELRHEAVSDVEDFLDGVVVWDRDFIQVFGVHFV